GLQLPEHARGKRGYVVLKKVATLAFLLVLRASCPPLRERGDYALLLIHLLREALRKNDSVLGVLQHPVPLPAYLVADIAGERERARNGNFSTTRYLEAFARAV